MPDTVWIFAGSVIAAVIVLFSGWLQQQIARASTVSGYRQKWIQDVRDAFSEYMNELERLADAASSNSVSNQCYGAGSTVLDDTRPVREKRNYLRLYTNPGEDDHSNLLEEAKAIETYLTDTVRQDLNMECYERRRSNLVGCFQAIVKEEWDRVKMGELKWRLRKGWRRITRRSSRRSQARTA